jgi:hypothetical protein
MWTHPDTGSRARRTGHPEMGVRRARRLFVVFPWVEPHLPFNAVTVD